MNKPLCIIGGRSSGKTGKLIELAEKHYCYIVVRDYPTAKRVAKRARREGRKIPFPLTYHEFIAGEFFGTGIRCFLIDDIEALLWYLARGVEVKGFSLDASSTKLLYLNRIEDCNECEE